MTIFLLIRGTLTNAIRGSSYVRVLFLLYTQNIIVKNLLKVFCFSEYLYVCNNQ